MTNDELPACIPALPTTTIAAAAADEDRDDKNTGNHTDSYQKSFHIH